jgi:FtsP/CotA-like multicopper oxidase with cupredoxin domain
MRSVLSTGRGRRLLTRGPAALLLPALAAVLAPPSAGAAKRELWVAAVPQTWNAVPNARDVIHGTRFGAADTTFPTVVYRRYTRGWKRPLRLSYEAAAGTGSIPGPLIRARVGDKLRIHFKNLDTLHSQAHSMHFHGVEYKPSSDGVHLPLHSGKGGRVKPGESFTYKLTAGPGSAGVWPYHDHSTSMDASIAGGMYGALSIAGRRERRADREFVVAFAPWHGFQTINGRAFVGNTPLFESRVGETVQWDVLAMGDEFHTFHVHGHKWRTDGGTPEDTRGLGPAESFRVRWKETAPGTWLYHCHVETHMAQGMIGLYRVRP